MLQGRSGRWRAQVRARLALIPIRDTYRRRRSGHYGLAQQEVSRPAASGRYDRQAKRPGIGGGADSGARDELVFGRDVALELGHHLGSEEPHAVLGDLIRHATVAEDAIERLGSGALLDVEHLLVAL